MLRITPNGSIQVEIRHLLDDVPTTWEGIIERYSKLNITLFHHLVSSPECRYEKLNGKGRVPDSVLAMKPKQRLKAILKAGEIQGNPKGYFVNKHQESLTASQLDEIKSVSFTLCEMSNVEKHFEARKSEYGICFFHDFLESAGIRPVVYLNGQDDDQRSQLIFNAPHLVEAFAPKYDMRWEKEWRIKGRLAFKPDDVAFLIIPDIAYKSFMGWLSAEELDDYVVMPASVFNSHLDYLRILPILGHSSWGQIRIFDGLLLDFEEFVEYTDDDRGKLLDATSEYLPFIAMADIQDLYEHRYVSRYLKFLGQLNGKSRSSADLQRMANVEKNEREPWRSSAHLVKAAYGELFKIQQDRITKNWQ